MANITYEIKSTLGTLSDGIWAPQLNLISWNHRAPSYDLRKWNTEDGSMGKGLTLTEEELRELRNILNEYFDED